MDSDRKNLHQMLWAFLFGQILILDPKSIVTQNFEDQSA
jgi:hypothetical protein